ncbi:hypothetical protein Tco_0894765 [Tanacetum coccineum]|uniref:Reverse transcriptase Ty1/copia-type domain-containing protein n=1 Tax=Tanacetum coccineum TaxID=301880 RepID=A0ABQ5CFB4_9ASTR
MIEAIRIFLAFASLHGPSWSDQMDVENVLLLSAKLDEDGLVFSNTGLCCKNRLKELVLDFVNVKTASSLMRPGALYQDEEASDVRCHLYSSIIGSLMYLTASRPDIMFAVCICSRFQVTLKTSHLSTIKRIFRYLKGKPKLGLWYPRVSSFDLEAYSDSDYAGANLDRKYINREVVISMQGD